ncbi:MAG TPA: DUF2061 domain-containing protein [Candidatus Paceibacterota bacterium]|nr:DUF2061 domain-containing protein [Candidatus Paceibacterota bacterium]
MPYENHARSVLKSITWRVIATIVTLFSVWFYTGALAVSVESTIAVAVISTIAYYFHERAWNHLAWGRVAASESGSR